MFREPGRPPVPARLKTGEARVARIDGRILAQMVIIGAVAAAIGLSACGRRGPLEPPPTAAATAAIPDDEAEEAKPAKPDRTFVLDPLIR